jgi:magnesium chelatase subunit D
MVHRAFATTDEFVERAPRDGLPLPPEGVAALRAVERIVDREELPEAALFVAAAELAREMGRERPRSGRRRSVATERPEGRYVRARLPRGNGDIAIDATVRAAATAGVSAPATASATVSATASASAPIVLNVAPSDIREKQRARRIGRLLVFVVDLSGSMGDAMLALARRAALVLLGEAYVKRDRVALVAFREQMARVILPPTRSVELARRRLRALATGGKTPLGFGLRQAHLLIRRALAGEPRLEPVMVVISDGKANVGSREGYGAVIAEVGRVAAALRAEKRVRVVLFDATEDGKDDFHATELAEQTGAARLKVHRLSALGGAALRELLRGI